MVSIVITSIIVALVVGLIVKFITDRKKSFYNITQKEFIISMTVISVIVAPGAVKLGWELAKTNKITYIEYLNGWETGVVEEKITCERDGFCSHEYQCDPYTVSVSYDCNCDEKGHCDTCYRDETRYHDCPYVDEERNYFVETTVGNFMIDSNRFPENPQNRRWRKSKSIPSYVIERAGTGRPQFWVEVMERLNKKLPGPVTKSHEYENYIYASEGTILKQYSSEIEKFKKSGLLPVFRSGVKNFYFADKAYFVGFKTSQQNEWQKKLELFNAAFGMRLQGDLHLVVVNNSEISANPDAYVIALKAYWQSIQEFGKNAFSKNALAVIIGTTDGKTIAWTRAFTGMPMGNEELVVALNNLKGIELKPEIIIGNTTINNANKLIVEFGKGVLEEIVFGLNDSKTRFKRISMTAKDKNDNGLGYLYLASEIEPDESQKVIILIVVSIFCCLGWAIALMIGENNYRRSSY